MSSQIKVGHSGTLRTVVQADQTIVLGGRKSAEVFSTPSMINLMEHAAREALRPFLSHEQESVGVDVNIKHLAATPPKNEVTATATITGVEKNVVSFDVVAKDSWETIGCGSHRRAILETSRIEDKLIPKQKPTLVSGSADDTRNLNLTQLNLDSLQFFTCKKEQRLLHVEINRPEKKNAISEKMTGELAVLVEWLAQNKEISVVVFSGADGIFSTGDDVSELDPTDPNRMRDLSLLRGSVYSRLANLNQVTIAAVDGFALGGGFVFAAACDFIVATHNAKFGLPEAKLGWPPNYGIEIVRSRLGRSKAIQWAVTGQLHSAQQALQAGLVEKVVASNQLWDAANQIAIQILNNAPAAISAIKKVFDLRDCNAKDALATEDFLKCLDLEFAKNSLAKFSSNKKDTAE